MESVESSLSLDSERQSGYNMGVMEKKSEIAFFMTVLAGGLWGTSAIFVHYLSPFGFTPVQMVSARGAVSFAGVFLYAIVKERKLFRIRPIELTIYLLIGGALFFTAFCYYTSMTLTSVATAAMLLGLSPVYVVLFSAVLWREKMSGLKTAAIIGVLAGGVFVSGVIEGMIFYGACIRSFLCDIYIADQIFYDAKFQGRLRNALRLLFYGTDCRGHLSSGRSLTNCVSSSVCHRSLTLRNRSCYLSYPVFAVYRIAQSAFVRNGICARHC